MGACFSTQSTRLHEHGDKIHAHGFHIHQLEIEMADITERLNYMQPRRDNA